MRILDRLTQCKGQFGPAAARRTERLLAQIERVRLNSSADLVRLHETALFLRAHPQSARVVELADAILFSFGERMCDVDRDDFDDPELSGIAGTSVSTNFSREFARSLMDRHRGTLAIDWDDFERQDRLGIVLGRLIPEAYELYSVEPHVDWRPWLKQGGRDARWLLDAIDPVQYELLEIPLRWSFPASASRSALRLPRREFFYHSSPFLKRGDVSIEAEFSGPPIHPIRLPSPQARELLGIIVDTSAVRYRELHGFQHPDDDHVYWANLGRGVDFYFFGVRRGARLPLRAYLAGMFFKNGVPMGYVEALSLFERCEAGFNLYYTFREGETAWLYARILKVLREQLGVTCFSIDPYQLGHENEEAIASGAFWFYYKLGFRPVDTKIAKVAAAEASKIASRPGYRSRPATLRRLAEAPLFYGTDASGWRGFSLQKAALDSVDFGSAAARAKRGPEETAYLRFLQRRPDLRRALLAPKSGD